MGKTLTFLDAASFFPAARIQVVIRPLNLLGKQNMQLLEKARMRAIFIGADTATLKKFLISKPLRILKDNQPLSPALSN